MSDNKDNEEGFSFIKEKIKDKPFNKKKAVLKIGYTIGLAILFGSIASFTFVMSKSLFEPMVGKQSEPEKVIIPKDSSEDSEEADDFMTEVDDSTEAADNNEVTSIGADRDQAPVSTEIALTLDDFEELYSKLYEKAQECEKAMVTVTGVTSDMDWFNDIYQRKGQSSGMIVADTDEELLICADYKTVEGVESITITFYNGETVNGSLQKYDGNTGLAILTVSKNEVSEDTKKLVQVVTLGNSYAVNTGDLVIAIGSPLGYTESISYGILTTTTNTVSTIGFNYRILTTNAVGSSDGSGVLVNLKGEVVGIIEPDYAISNDNCITALAISDLKTVIERLSNNLDIVYIGIKGSDVTTDIAEEQNIPEGVYVTEAVMDSPAMKAGIQRGDVIVAVNGEEISTLRDYQKELIKYVPSQVISVSVMRLGKGEWKEIQFTVTLDALQ